MSGFTIPEVEPRLFSFNSPHGACPSCSGLGSQMTVDPALIVPDPDLTLKNGAIAPWARSSSPYTAQTLDALGKAYGFRSTSRWRDLSDEARDAILNGSGGREIEFAFDDGLRSYKTKKTFEGIVPNLTRRYKETESDWSREDIQRFMSETPCEACAGHRLKPEALSVKIDGRHIGEVAALSVREARDWFEALPGRLGAKQNDIAARILKEIRERLRFLMDVGLDYLNLSRASGTLSGGESQRIRLASQIGSGLSGVLYVLDEPSIGLHQRDNARLLDTLRRLRDLGNTVIVVEHDEDAVLTADHVVDVGPAQASTAAASWPRAPRPRSWRTRPRSPASISRARWASTCRPGAARPTRAASSGSSARAATTSSPCPPTSRSAPSPASPACPDRASRPCFSTRSTGRWRASSTAPRTCRSRTSASRASNTSTRSSTSTSRRSGARRARTPRPTPAPSPRSATGSRVCPRPRRAATSRPLLLQRQGRALRGLPGRRRHQDRDALPAGRLRHL